MANFVSKCLSQTAQLKEKLSKIQKKNFHRHNLRRFICIILGDYAVTTTVAETQTFN